MVPVDATTLFSASVVILLAVWYFKSRKPHGLPPGPRAWPIIGNLNLVYKNDHFHNTLHDLSYKYGGLFSLQMGFHPTIVISDPKVLHEALIEKADSFSDRPLHLTLVKLLFRGNGVVFQNGEKWEKVRKLVISSMRSFGVGKSSVEDKIQDEAHLLMRDIESTLDKPFHLNHTFHKAVCNIVCSIVFGKSFDHDDTEFKNLLDDLTRLFSTGDFQNLAIYMPVLGLILTACLHPSIVMTLITSLKTRQFAKRRVKEHRQQFDPNNISDFLDMYLDAERKEKADASYTDGMIFQSIMDLFFAGTESTSTTLLWMFLFFIKHPEIQDRCRKEIFQAVGQERPPCMKDKQNTPYLEATILEVLRIAMAAPIGGLHNTAKTTTLGGYTIPKNTIVITNFYAVQTDPKLWPDPLSFKPERFLDESGQLLSKFENFMPFGLGKRKCLGDTLAKTELFIIISSLLQRFRFKAVDINKLPGITDSKFGINLIPPKYELIAERL